MKKILALLLALLMVAFVLVGCDSTKDETPSTDDSQQTPSGSNGSVDDPDDITGGDSTTGGDETVSGDNTTGGDETTDSDESSTTDDKKETELIFRYSEDKSTAVVIGIKNMELKEVVIPSSTYDGASVIGIDVGTFRGCTALISVTIPNSVTKIERLAFEGCTSLTNISISDYVKYIGETAFENTAYYNSEANWDGDVLYIGKHLIKAKTTLSGEYSIRTDTILIACRAFDGCSELTGVNIPNTVTNIGAWAFSSCKKVTEITLPNGMSSIEEGTFAFSGLKNISLPDNVTSIGDRGFYWCSLTNIDLNNVTSIGQHAFEDCRGFESIAIPSSVKNIGYRAFYNCDRIKNVNITDLKAWCEIEFDGESANPLYSDSYEVANLCLNGETLTEIVVPEGTTKINDYAFYDYTVLKSITIPDSVTSIGYGAFESCTNLESVTISKNLSSISGSAFSLCTNLKNIYFDGSKEEWEGIKKDSEWYKDQWIPATVNFTIHCTNGDITIE